MGIGEKCQSYHVGTNSLGIVLRNGFQLYIALAAGEKEAQNRLCI